MATEPGDRPLADEPEILFTVSMVACSRCGDPARQLGFIRLIKDGDIKHVSGNAGHCRFCKLYWTKETNPPSSDVVSDTANGSNNDQ
jgi:hypothetical protein